MITGEYVKQDMPIMIPETILGIHTRKQRRVFIDGVDICYLTTIPLLDENIMIIDININ